jgi:3-keto-5-aminohexanoate cleavage enzyme
LALAKLITDDGATAEAALLGWLKREDRAAVHPQQIARYHNLRDRGVIPQRRPLALLVLGRYADQIEAQPQDLLPYLAAHDAACPWSLCAFGPREGSRVLTAAGLGGYVQGGFKKKLWRADGRLAASIAEEVPGGVDLHRTDSPASRIAESFHKKHQLLKCPA